jgi:hypothetical protein
MTDGNEKVYLRSDKFLQAQLQEFQKSGHFIKHLTIVPFNGFPANLEDVTSMLDLLQTNCGAVVKYVVMVSQAVSFQASWHRSSQEYGNPEAGAPLVAGGISWNVDFLEPMTSNANSMVGKKGCLFVLTNS